VLLAIQHIFKGLTRDVIERFEDMTAETYSPHIVSEMASVVQ
jgi:hypothetical protein